MKPAVRMKPNVAGSAAATVAMAVFLALSLPLTARAEETRNFGSSPAGNQASARGLDLPAESQLEPDPPSAATPRENRPQAETSPSLASQDGQLKPEASPPSTPRDSRLEAVASPSLTSQDVRLQAETQPTPPQGLVQAIRKLQGGKGWEKTSKKLTRQERDDLKTFYEADGQEPLWVTQDGINGAARALLAEFGNADAFGLRARDYAVSADVPAAATPEALARRELELTATALIYARHAKAGRAAAKKLGRQLPYKPRALPPRDVLAGLQAAADPSQYLRALHPQHPQFLKLQRKLAELREPQRPGAGPRIPAGPVLKPGMSHPHVALLRQRLGVPATDQAAGDDNAFDTALAAAVKKFQRENGLGADGIVGNGTRRALNGPSPQKAIAKIILNMERWRWLPDDLAGSAKIYVWSNIPELKVRVVQDGRTVFSEKSIVGQVSHKTPIFSDRMEWIEFHPTWYVPASIKNSDILPSLRRPTSTVMERYNLRVNCGKYGSNWRDDQTGARSTPASAVSRSRLAS